MKLLAAVAFLCLASCALASLLAPYGALPYGTLGLGGVAHYAGLPVGRAVAYGSTINHGVVRGLGLAPYGLRYGLGLAAPIAPVAAVKYGVPAAPLAIAPAYGLGYSKGLIL